MLQTTIPLVTLHPDDSTPTNGVYDRTDMGVFVIAKNPVGGKLYGFDVTTGNWKSSVDGVTWTDHARTPETDFGSKAVSIVFSGASWWATAMDGKLWRGTVDTFNSWTDVTPPTLPANTTGRYLNAAHNGTILFYSNYGLAGKYSTPGDPSGAYVYKSTDGGNTWTRCLSVPRGAPCPLRQGGPHRRAQDSREHRGSGSVGGFGCWYSPDAGVTWYQGASGNSTPGAAPSNRYGIDICCPPGTSGTPCRIFMEGDGTAQPHVFQYYRANLGSGMFNAKIDATVWFDDNPEDGGDSWKGSVRGLFATSERNLFYISTGEAGGIGTR